MMLLKAVKSQQNLLLARDAKINGRLLIKKTPFWPAIITVNGRDFSHFPAKLQYIPLF